MSKGQTEIQTSNIAGEDPYKVNGQFFAYVKCDVVIDWLIGEEKWRGMSDAHNC